MEHEVIRIQLHAGFSLLYGPLVLAVEVIGGGPGGEHRHQPVRISLLHDVQRLFEFAEGLIKTSGGQQQPREPQMGGGIVRV